MIHPGFLLALVGAALVRGDRGRRLAALATATAGLGLAALPTVPIPAGQPDLAGFMSVEAALLTLGAALALLAAVEGIREGRSPGSLVGSAAVAGGGVGVGLAAVPVLAAAPVGALLIALLSVAALGILLILGARRLGVAPHPDLESVAASPALAAIGLGTLVAAAAPFTGAVFAATIVTAAGGWLLRRAVAGRIPVAPLLTLLLLPAWWLMRTNAGPEGLAVTSLPDLPWSPAAERLLAPVLLIAAWSTSGLWPLHRQEPAVLTAPVGALLLVRVVLPAIPDGVEHWRALAMPLVVVGLWHAVLTGRRAGAVSALAWVGLLSSEPSGRLAAGLLLAGGLVMRLAGKAPRMGLGAALRLCAVVSAGVGAFLAIGAGLRAEVVYSVMAAAALIAAVGRDRPAHARMASAPSATAPSL
jgi:hypothetical protein